MTTQAIDLLVPSPDEAVGNDSQQFARKSGAGSAPAATAIPQRSEVRYVPAGNGPAYWGPGERMTFLITGKETGGAFFLADVSVAPGGGTPPHIHHREDESFHILEGSLTVQVGGDTITASAGDFVYLPRGIAHSFRNTGDGSARILCLATPARLEGFFAEVFDPAVDDSAPPVSKELIAELIARAQGASPRYGLELLLPA